MFKVQLKDDIVIAQAQLNQHFTYLVVLIRFKNDSMMFMNLNLKHKPGHDVLLWIALSHLQELFIKVLYLKMIVGCMFLVDLMAIKQTMFLEHRFNKKFLMD